MPSDPGPSGRLSGDTEFEVRLVHPFEATKEYRCPGCNHAVAKGTGHVVVVPVDAPDQRRHWHRPCWTARSHRRPGRA